MSTPNKLLHYFTVSIGLLISFSACKKETLNAPSLSFNYFPTETGKWVEYSVDSIYHGENDNDNDDSVYTFHFQIREEIDSSFVDVEGRTNQQIRRFRRLDSTFAWTISDVWTQRVNSVSAYRTENNISYHKLAFPINASITWNGNDANMFQEELYSYNSYHEPATVQGLSFDSTISVLQIDEDNYIQRLYGNEQYAAGIGLIYKERVELGKKNGIVVNGLEYKMQITDYGSN